MTGMSRRAAGVVALGVVAAFVGTALLPAVAAKKPLTKKRALTLFYTKGQADDRYLTSGEAGPMFLDQGEADQRFLQGQGTVVSLAADEATTDAGETTLSTPPIGQLAFDCAMNGTPLVEFQNRSGESAIVSWDLIRTPSTANEEHDPAVADGAEEGPGTGVGVNDFSIDFEIATAGHVVTASVGANEGGGDGVCTFIAQAVIDQI